MYRYGIKRALDIIFSLLAIVILFPVCFIIAGIIYFTMGTPIIFSQERIGKDEKIFLLYKFRSMTDARDKDGNLLDEDQRISKVGAVLRSLSLDELPELFCILKGDMSFIGPRPERPEIIEQYMREMPEFAFRMKVKAGLAGYAQVYGKYNTTPYDKLKLDLTYVENYSVWLDLKLMLLTLKILIKPESTEGVESSQVTAMKEP